MRRRFLLALSLITLLSLPAAQNSRAEIPPWQPLPGPYGGYMTVLALSPAYPTDHTLFAGMGGQGIYRSTEWGRSWRLVSPGDWPITDLTISPAYATDGTIFATTGVPEDFHVYRSTDRGTSWVDVTPAWIHPPSAPTLAISSAFDTDRTLYVLAGTYIYRSTDGGASFTAVSGWLFTHSVSELAFSPTYATDQTLFALAQSEGLYKSPDGGTTWNPTGLSGNLSTFAVSPDYATDRTLIAADRDSGQLYLSNDDGVTWAPPEVQLAPAGRHTLRFSPTFATDRLILAASSADPGPYLTADGGTEWSPVGWYDPEATDPTGILGGEVYDLALTPDTSNPPYMFAATGSGIYRGQNTGMYWSRCDRGLARLTVRTLAGAPGDPAILLAGASFSVPSAGGAVTESGVLALSGAGGHYWQIVTGRLERVRAVAFSPDFTNDRLAFAATGASGSYTGGCYRSTDGGKNWTATLDGAACMALALSPDFSQDHTLWASTAASETTSALYRSSDSGATWTWLTSTVPARSLVPSPNYAVDRTLFAGTSTQGLQKSSDGGATWTQLLRDPITALAVSPAYGASRTLYAAVQPDPPTPYLLLRSGDGGATWQELHTGIPPTWEGQPLTIATLAFATDGSVLAGVFYGDEAGGGAVYRSSDGGDTWQELGSGLAEQSIFTLATLPGNSLTGYAGSDGGLWQLEVSQGGPAEPGHWETHGPRGGMAQALAVSPDFVNDGVVFSGEHRMWRPPGEFGLGIFKSTDWAQTWAPAAHGTEAYSSAIHDFAFSPDFAADRTVFAATWGGLFKSGDGGATWEWLSGLYSGPPGSITAIAAAPDFSQSGQLLAGDGWSGVYVSQDSGDTWQRHDGVSAASAVAYSPGFANDGVAFAAGGGLHKTTDRGASWTQVLTPAHGISALALSPQFESDGVLYVASEALYVSGDGGTTWISHTVTTDSTRLQALAISPAFGADLTLFAGDDEGLYRSENGGNTWEPVTAYPGPAVQSLAISPGWPEHPVLLVGAFEGVYRTTDGGVTWAKAAGMAPLATSTLLRSLDGGLLLAGAESRGVYGSDDDGATWASWGLQNSDIRALALSPDYAEDGTLFATVTAGAGLGLYRTTDGGATWEYLKSTDYPGGDLAISPQYAEDHTLYLTGQHGQVLRSGDSGETWAVMGELPPGSASLGAWWIALPPAYPVDSTLFAAGNAGFWRLPAGGTTWEPAASGLISDVFVSSIAVSPQYATDRTLLATAADGVYRSDDGGVNWSLASTGLPDRTLPAIAFSLAYAIDHTAYVISDERLYRSRDGGLSWSDLGAPPDAPDLHDLTVEDGGAVTVASAAGVWRYTAAGRELIINGGFEAGSGWGLPETAWPAGYAKRVVYDGKQSLRAGIDNGENHFSYSSASQTLTIPADAGNATLRFYIYPVSGETLVAAQRRAFPQGRLSADQPTATGDAQYLLLIDEEGHILWPALFWELSNAQHWQPHCYDLTSYAGQTLTLHFGVRNDGTGGRTAMYVDNVSLIVTHRVYLPLVLKSWDRG